MFNDFVYYISKESVENNKQNKDDLFKVMVDCIKSFDLPFNDNKEVVDSVKIYQEYVLVEIKNTETEEIRNQQIYLFY